MAWPPQTINESHNRQVEKRPLLSYHQGAVYSSVVGQPVVATVPATATPYPMASTYQPVGYTQTLVPRLPPSHFHLLTQGPPGVYQGEGQISGGEPPFYRHGSCVDWTHCAPPQVVYAHSHQAASCTHRREPGGAVYLATQQVPCRHVNGLRAPKVETQCTCASQKQDVQAPCCQQIGERYQRDDLWRRRHFVPSARLQHLREQETRRNDDANLPESSKQPIGKSTKGGEKVNLRDSKLRHIYPITISDADNSSSLIRKVTAGETKQDGSRVDTKGEQKPDQTSKRHLSRKPRKPYTITRNREVWTDEEHSKFVQALHLYDRNWKRIQQFVGTKSVLQIRSHAQKYFGKVVKYNTGEYVPPPRPKRKASAPYPHNNGRIKVEKRKAKGDECGKDPVSYEKQEREKRNGDSQLRNDDTGNALTRDADLKARHHIPTGLVSTTVQIPQLQSAGGTLEKIEKPFEYHKLGHHPSSHLETHSSPNCHPSYQQGWSSMQTWPSTGMETTPPPTVLQHVATVVSREPAPGWRSAASTRRARRAQIMRDRKAPEISASTRQDISDVIVSEGSEGSSGVQGSSGSDLGMAGLSGSDRPALSDSGNGSPTGEDPSSSHDGSGDDRRRNASADPASGGSRENTPGESGSGNEVQSSAEGGERQNNFVSINVDGCKRMIMDSEGYHGDDRKIAQNMLTNIQKAVVRERHGGERKRIRTKVDE